MDEGFEFVGVRSGVGVDWCEYDFYESLRCIPRSLDKAPETKIVQ